MSSRFVVELDRRVVGLALRCRGGFRFFASEAEFHKLDGAEFPRFRALLQAVRRRAADAKATQLKPGPAGLRSRP